MLFFVLWELGPLTPRQVRADVTRRVGWRYMVELLALSGAKGMARLTVLCGLYPAAAWSWPLRRPGTRLRAGGWPGGPSLETCAWGQQQLGGGVEPVGALDLHPSPTKCTSSLGSLPQDLEGLSPSSP